MAKVPMEPEKLNRAELLTAWVDALAALQMVTARCARLHNMVLKHGLTFEDQAARFAAMHIAEHFRTIGQAVPAEYIAETQQCFGGFLHTFTDLDVTTLILEFNAKYNDRLFETSALPDNAQPVEINLLKTRR